LRPDDSGHLPTIPAAWLTPLQLAQKREFLATQPPTEPPSWFQRQWQGVRDFWFRNHLGTRLEGALQVTGGVGMVWGGVGGATGGTILGWGITSVVAIPVGGGIALAGVDQGVTGWRKVWDGQERPSLIAQGIDAAAGEGTGWYYEAGVGVVGNVHLAYSLWRNWSLITQYVQKVWQSLLGRRSPPAPNTPATATPVSPPAAPAKAPAPSSATTGEAATPTQSATAAEVVTAKPTLPEVATPSAAVPSNVAAVQTPQIKPLDWSIGSKSGESRQAHVSLHGANNLQKQYHGVFYGDPVTVTNEAWALAQQLGLKPISVGGVDIYVIPRPNSGWMGGFAGQGQNLNCVTIITKKGTHQLITAFPGKGLPLPRPIP
jgi:hypothetical protein